MVRAGGVASALYIKLDLTLIIITVSLIIQIQTRVWFFIWLVAFLPQIVF